MSYMLSFAPSYLKSVLSHTICHLLTQNHASDIRKLIHPLSASLIGLPVMVF